MSLISIYKRNKKRCGRSRYLLSVTVEVVKDGKAIPAKVVYVRNRNKRKEYPCLISTDVNPDGNENILICGKRWDIEVFFKVCKSYLNPVRECRAISHDTMTARTAVVFTRYMMLSMESRESNDNRSPRELFLYFSGEMSDITWIQAFQMLLQMFRTMLSDMAELTDENPGRMFFIETDEGEKIATATAFYDIYGRDTSGDGWLHWVAVKREYQGNGLSKPLITYVLRAMNKLGYVHAKFLHRRIHG